MAQILKESVQERILTAALVAFAETGFQGTSVAAIARGAGVSTGNVYRYFENKDVLFEAAVPPAFARKLSALLRQRVDALRGVVNVAGLPEDARWRVISQQLLELAFENRLRVVIALSPQKSAGTGLATFRERTLSELVERAEAYGRSLEPARTLGPEHRLVLSRIYAGLLDTVAAVLQAHESRAAVDADVLRFTTYHLAGMKAFIEEIAT